MTNKPAAIDGHYRLASEALAIGDVGAAEALLNVLIAARPREGRAHNLLGALAYGAGKAPAAAEYFAQAIRLDPENGDYYSDLALALSQMGEQEAAITGFRASIYLKPDGPAAHNNLGTELQSQGKFAEAEVCFRKALALHPGFVQAYNNLGCVLRDMGKPALALEPLEKALGLSPQIAELHNSLGNVLRDLGRLDDAIGRYAEAIRLKPDHIHAHNSLGSVYCDQDRLDDAMARQLQVLAIDPLCADAHTNLGVVWQRMGRPDLAVRAYRDAIRLDPKTTSAQTNLAMALLLLGDYPEGWRLYEKRWLGSHLKFGARTFEQPQWNGELEPKRLLIHAEQGFGDSLQFCRYLPLIDPRHEVIFEVEAPLVELMRQLPGVDKVIACGAPLPDFDAHCPLMSLPLVFGTTLDSIPNQAPYLRANPEKVAGWAKRMEPLKGLRVGLVWAGGARPNQPELAPTNRRRSMTLSALAPLAQATGVSFVSLQKGPPASEAHSPPAGMTLLDFTADLHDFTDTAALVETLDLVISVDTAVAHLAAALGKPVWLLNRFDTCWRWLMDRDDSPWYPTVRLFRQSAPGDWGSVAAEVATALQHAADLSEDRSAAVVTTEPATVEGRYQLARDFLAIGQVDVAELILKELIAAQPHEGPAHRLLGLIASGAGKDGPAAEYFAQAIRLEPENGEYYSDLALVLSRMGERDAAIAGFRAAIHLKPDSPIAHNNLGAELRSKGQFVEAVACFGKALSLQPDYVEAHYNMGCALRDIGKPDLALAPLEKAVALSPQTPEIHLSLGNVLRDLGRPDDSIVCFLESIRLKPDYIKAHNNLGALYYDLDRIDEALERHREALAIDPQCAASHSNLGVVLQRMGRPDLAARAYREAIRLDPETSEAPNNLAMALLLQGDYAEGWRQHERRWLSRPLKLGLRAFEQPAWTGDLGPKRLLIHAEQGLGDTLQFCRYLPLIDRRHEIVFEVQPPLVDLMRQLAGVGAVVARGEPLPDFDAHCPIMSLPFIFETTLDTIPNQTPYLKADAEKVAGWATRLEPAKGLRVGLVWAGGARPNQPELEPTNRRRSMTLSALAPLAQAAGVSFVSLQKGPPASEAHAPPPGMILFDFTDDLRDFTDTAALVETLDLVISVDTAVAHLAAAMGKPVWLLNRFDTCWRWLMNRDDSPWYPTVRLFRQRTPGDWDAVAMDIAAALQQAVDVIEDRPAVMVRAA